LYLNAFCRGENFSTMIEVKRSMKIKYFDDADLINNQINKFNF
jgi:hypothetical protein